MKEKWKFIRGFDKQYRISDKGRVGYVHKGKLKIMSLCNNNYGYQIISLERNKKKKTVFVHRLVGKAFIPNPKHKPQINHKDGIKTNNNVSNLEWCTQSENQIHAFKTRLNVPKRGQDSTSAKLSNSMVRRIRKLSSSMTQTELAKKFKVNQGTISRIINYKRRKRK